MQQFKYSEFNQNVYQKQLDNGLLVTMLPMEGFHKTYAVLSTEFGSIDNTFVPDQKNELLTVGTIACQVYSLNRKIIYAA